MKLSLISTTSSQMVAATCLIVAIAGCSTGPDSDKPSPRSDGQSTAAPGAVTVAKPASDEPTTAPQVEKIGLPVEIRDEVQQALRTVENRVATGDTAQAILFIDQMASDMRSAAEQVPPAQKERLNSLLKQLDEIRTEAHGAQNSGGDLKALLPRLQDLLQPVLP